MQDILYLKICILFLGSLLRCDFLKKEGSLRDKASEALEYGLASV